jgi:hypothetical protein
VIPDIYMRWAVFAPALVVGLYVAIGLIISSIFGVNNQISPLVILTPILTTFILACAPALRLDSLGKYLRQQGGIDSIATRGSFRARDDHFLLDYSIGRWFQHGSFAFGYVALIGVYFMGWFMISLFLLLWSIPLLLVAFMISRRSARSLLSPYNPRDVALRIELIYPPKSLRRMLGQLFLGRT